METQALTWLWGSPGRDLACLHQGALAGYCQQGEAEHRLQAAGRAHKTLPTGGSSQDCGSSRL